MVNDPILTPTAGDLAVTALPTVDPEKEIVCHGAELFTVLGQLTAAGRWCSRLSVGSRPSQWVVTHGTIASRVDDRKREEVARALRAGVYKELVALREARLKLEAQEELL